MNITALSCPQKWGGQNELKDEFLRTFEIRHQTTDVKTSDMTSDSDPIIMDKAMLYIKSSG